MIYQLKNIDRPVLRGLLIQADLFKLIINYCQPDTIKIKVFNTFFRFKVILLKLFKSDTKL